MARMYAILLALVVFHSNDMQVSSQAGTVHSALFDYISRIQDSRTQQQQQTVAATTPPAQPAVDSIPNNVAPSNPNSNPFEMYTSLMNPGPQPPTQPETQPQTFPVNEPQPPTQPETQPQTFPVNEPQPQPPPQTQPLTLTETQPLTQPQTQPLTQPQAQPQMQPQMPPLTQPQTQPQLQPLTQPLTQPQMQPQAQPQPQLSSGSGILSAKSFADLFNSALRPTNTAPAPYQSQVQHHGPTPQLASNPLSVYQQHVQSSSHTGYPRTAALPTNQPSNFVQYPRVQNAPSFVPGGWNIPQARHPWGSSTHHGSAGRNYNQPQQGHHHHHHHQTQQHHHQQQTQQQPHQHAHYQNHPMDASQPAAHPLARMMMIPKFRNMVNRQATQFGDLAYYQQLGCVDPTPTLPGPGGIRPTQTLWMGCQSPVSKMVCRRAGALAAGGGKGGAGGASSMMMVMMKMMNPGMTRTLEKCLTPKALTSIMFQGMSGGAGGGGGMNPAMMMMMSGGGGGGMASVLPMIMMMNRQNNAAAATSPAAADPSAGAGGLLDLTPAANAMPSKSYRDPSAANTLISQAARIPLGAAQPQLRTHQTGNGFPNLFGGMFGGGGQQTPVTSTLPVGAAGPSAGLDAMGMGTGTGMGEAPVDCSAVMPMIMSAAMAAGEGLGSPEAMEAVTAMRKKYLPYSCQELRLKYTGLPMNMCCPGRVDQPSMMDLFKAKSAGAA